MRKIKIFCTLCGDNLSENNSEYCLRCKDYFKMLDKIKKTSIEDEILIKKFKKEEKKK